MKSFICWRSTTLVSSSLNFEITIKKFLQRNRNIWVSYTKILNIVFQSSTDYKLSLPSARFNVDQKDKSSFLVMLIPPLKNYYLLKRQAHQSILFNRSELTITLMKTLAFWDLFSFGVWDFFLISPLLCQE